MFWVHLVSREHTHEQLYSAQCLTLAERVYPVRISVNLVVTKFWESRAQTFQCKLMDTGAMCFVLSSLSIVQSS